MEFKKRPVVLITVISLLLFFSATSLKAADITIKPKIATRWKTDSNFFKAETSERKVDTYLVQPGIDLGFEAPRSKVLLNYTLNAYYYDDRDTVPSGQQKADDDDYVGHTVVFNSRYRAFDRLLIGLDDSYNKTRDSADLDRFSNTTDRDKYFINRLTPLLFYDFGAKFTAGLRYRNTIIDYSKNDKEDSTEHRGMFDLIYNFTRKTSLDLEYQRWKKDYDKTTSDFTSDQIQLIFRKQFKHAVIKAGGGYHERDFDDPALKNIDTLAYTVSVRVQNPPAPEARPRSYLQFSAELNFNDQGIADSYYKAHRFSVDAGHIFLEKLKVDIGGYYQDSDYERTIGLTPAGTTEFREDDLYFISGSIGYIFADYLTFSVSASYEDRDSNLSGYNYDNKSVMATLDFGYDIGRR
ncbi:MAG: outer membrane beta-barrel protein [Candidatus Thermoplasmatota archaeon]|nr:outer membrane beta-barrel protein [Candidatus Thermoplasmatota archaeon]